MKTILERGGGGETKLSQEVKGGEQRDTDTFLSLREDRGRVGVQ